MGATALRIGTTTLDTNGLMMGLVKFVIGAIALATGARTLDSPLTTPPTTLASHGNRGFD